MHGKEREGCDGREGVLVVNACDKRTSCETECTVQWVPHNTHAYDSYCMSYSAKYVHSKCHNC